MKPGLTKGIFYGLIIGSPVWIAPLWAMHAFGDEVKPPVNKLTGWVHVVGCPHTSKAIGQNNVVLIFDNGESVSIDLNKQAPEKLDDLKAFIGNVQGYTFVAKCEMAT